ncbi:MAG TPA: SgcJ/EcaC family oxidoreductase [Candidatus Eisenbacteria bacterium]|jgi:uncharacterized protein (TIGR02246 family)
MSDSTRLEADLEAIRRLHEMDQRAAKAGDFAALRALFTEDAVILPPGAVALRGRDAIRESFIRMSERPRTEIVLEYQYDPDEVQVVGDLAYEWGVFRGRVRREDGTEVEERCKAMRILKRQPSGEWKIHRTMWNAIEEGSGG